jgi:hypothetical protein
MSITCYSGDISEVSFETETCGDSLTVTIDEIEVDICQSKLADILFEYADSDIISNAVDYILRFSVHLSDEHKKRIMEHLKNESSESAILGERLKTLPYQLDQLDRAGDGDKTLAGVFLDTLRALVMVEEIK